MFLPGSQLTPQEQDEFNAFIFYFIGLSSLFVDPSVFSMPGTVVVFTASVLVYVSAPVIVFVSGSRSGPESEKIAALHGLDDPSIPLEGDFMATKVRE